MNKDKNKNRISYLDNICGLLIINMVFFVHIRMHADVTTGIVPYINNLLCFFMPWFFYKSGMFYCDENWKLRIRKDFKTLIVPYIYFTIFGWIVYACSSLIIGKISVRYLVLTPIKEIIFNEAIIWNGALWFLPSLFVVKLLACVLFKRLNAFVWLIISVVTAIIMHYVGYNYPFYLGNIMLGLFFYSLGYLMKDVQFKTIIFIVALIFYVISVAVPFISGYFDFRYNMINERDNYFLVLAYSLSGIILYNNIFKRFIKKEIPGLSGIGRNSIIILCVHYPIIKLLTGILSRIHSFSPVQLWCNLTILMIPLIWLSVLIINRKARFLIGK